MKKKRRIDHVIGRAGNHVTSVANIVVAVILRNLHKEQKRVDNIGDGGGDSYINIVRNIKI